MSQELLENLRGRMAQVDRQLLQLTKERQQLSAEVGQAKRDLGLATRDFGQEKEVIRRAREMASELQLDAELAEGLMLQLIRSSLTLQEKDRLSAEGRGDGQRVLIIGGSGKMGQWLTRFLSSQGFTVEVADPIRPAHCRLYHQDWRRAPLDQELIFVAAPMREMREILLGLAERKPRGVVIDVASIKGLFREGLSALLEAGVAVTSIHPMFGPDTELLSGRHVIFIELGAPAATAAARALFTKTMAVQVEMSLDEHDRLIAYVLGLSHALNIAFVDALAGSGEAAPRLAKLSSTTFDAQLALASGVVHENPRMYFEIQSQNKYNETALAALAQSVARLRDLVAAGDEAGFVELMEQGRRYVENRR